MNKISIVKFLENFNVNPFEDNGHLRVCRSKYRISIPSLNEDVAYLIGVILGDGCLRTPSKNKKGNWRFRIQITISDKRFFDRICDLVEENFNYRPRFHILRGRYETYINSNIIFAYFALFGIPIGEKIGRLKIPKTISENKNLFYSFLAGFLDTDGHIEKPSIYIYQSDKMILEEIKKVLEKFDIKSTLVHSPFKLKGEMYDRFYLRFRIDFKSSEILELLRHPRHENFSGPDGI